ncbi:MAG: peptide chain release factor 2 [Candidatus Omnitrophica bacterium]|nr:peptide chain release factor 2 [Candidatus Omnitrophota bacterium]MBD3269122.1 peptide chain release factor 2 [Candidatus Omnitrophota bacterium]
MQELQKELNLLEEGILNIGEVLNIEEKRSEVKKIQLQMAEPGFWDDPGSAREVVARLKYFKSDVDDWDILHKKIEDLKEISSLQDSSMESEINEELAKIRKEYENLKLRVLFSGKFDDSNAILEINSGAGGTEACDWAGMLFRMYFRWAEDKKFKFKVLDELRGEEAGLKSVTFIIEGERVYGLLKAERGVHRLVRISPFDSNKRRHTSFASIDVLPEIKEDIDIEIKPDDIRIDTYRSSGAGGQHVNVTDSAVRITHLPTNIVVSCQNERSQHQNRQTALKVLKAKLYELKEKEQAKELEKMSGKKQKIEWGSQIRSYVLHPYLLVKDHRTNFENHDAWAVLDGKIDGFMYAYLKYRSREKNA